MKNIVILNRQILTFMDKNPDFYPEEKFAIIRFFNPGSHYNLNFPESCVAHLEIVCDDVTNIKMPSAERYVFFSREDAKKILEFIEKNKESFDQLICACEAGISRSAACGAVLEKIFLDTDEIYSSTKYFPNSLIYHTIWNTHFYGDRMK
jgi:predicted protein tyrosine phosphatase